MLKQVIDSIGLTPQVSADLLGISPRIFTEWLAGQRAIPESMVCKLSTVLGFSSSVLRATKKLKGQEGDIAPAIWFKLNSSSSLGEADREFVLLVRQHGYYLDQLEKITKSGVGGWKSVFEDTLRRTDIQAPPREQGRQAAQIFREATGLGHGASGIGRIIRGHLRSKGMLVMETPLPDSIIEGCTFLVGSPPAVRPCIFANLYKTTWFRRNIILSHEVCHAIFDASNQVSVDLSSETSDIDLSEERARAFSQELLIPARVLRHLAQANGIDWSRLGPKDLAVLVAQSHVEERLIIKAAVEYEFLDPESAQKYLQLEIHDELKKISDHALSTSEYIAKLGGTEHAPWAGKRDTTISSRSIQLPVPYIAQVLDVFADGLISRGKAAELLMIDQYTFDERFSAQIVGAGEI